MKAKRVKIITIIAIIVLITMISFIGVYTQVQNRMENQVKNYSYAMDINGTRTIVLTPSTDNKTTIKDTDGKEVENSSNLTDAQIAEKGYTKEESKYNEDDVLTSDNYEKSKQILEERFKDLEIKNYLIRVNEETGNLTLEIDENTDADTIVSNITQVGKFEIIDSDTQEVLMDNNDIKLVNVMYGSNSSQTSTSSGTSAYLNIEFNDDGTKKLENITGTYVNTTSNNTSSNTTDSSDNTQNTDTTTDNDTSSSTTNKKITMKIDDEKIMSTSFDQVIKTGKLQLTVGTSTTDKTKLKENAKKASNIAMILDNGNLPIKYTTDENKYILSDITTDTLQKVEIGVAILAGIALIILMFRYKVNGILSAISFIGFASILLLTIRYANVILSIEGIFAIVIILILNYIFNDKLLNNIRKANKEKVEIENTKKQIKETYKNFVLRIIPISIMSIAFCFANWIPMSSFGMVTFWGIVLILIYNLLFTSTLVKLQSGIVEAKDNKLNKPKVKSSKKVKEEKTDKIVEKKEKNNNTKTAKEQKTKANNTKNKTNTKRNGKNK